MTDCKAHKYSMKKTNAKDVPPQNAQKEKNKSILFEPIIFIKDISCFE